MSAAQVADLGRGNLGGGTLDPAVMAHGLARKRGLTGEHCRHREQE
jgi:hypothetical protein